MVYVARRRAGAVLSLLYQNRNGPAAGRYTDEPLSDDGPQGKFKVTDLGMM